VGAAIGQSLPFAVAVALSAGAIILEVLMLLTRRGRINGPSFLVGRTLGIATVGAILLVIASPSGASDRAAFTPLKAGGIGLALVFLNLKNLLLMVGGAAAVAQTGIPAGQQVVAWTVFTLIASIGVAAPVVIYFAMGTRAESTLDRLRDWMARNNTVITAVICLLFGAKLVGDALTGFSN
jgi:hypothetical protein